jgi:hypothetical protein
MRKPGQRQNRRGAGRWISAGTVVALCLGTALALPFAPTTARAGAPPCPLYYSLDIPPVLRGFEMDDKQNQYTVYTGLLRGTLGGLPVEKATVMLRPGASDGAGGGTFTLQTAAGEVANGLVLMTTDTQVTSLWFSGIYLGARIAFRVSGAAKDISGTAFAGKGLADTSFADNNAYLAAVSQAVANLAPAARAQALAGADRNLSLVDAYQQETGTP